MFGKILCVSTFGESHGKAVGAVLDGFPAGVALSEADIQPYLNRRRPGGGYVSTPRSEADKVEILSGVFDGATTGTPIAMLVRNTSQQSGDYDHLRDVYRPGHADFTYETKYGIRDHRGGGRASGRETAARVMAGAVCMKLLKTCGIDVCAYVKSIGDVAIDPAKFDRDAILTTTCAMPDIDADERAARLIAESAKEGNSFGSVIECRIAGAPKGLGDPVFDKLDAQFAKALMSIGAVKAIEIGDGFQVAQTTGAENNDAFANENGAIVKKTNHAGGVLGGISDGSDIVLRCHIKPTPSIAKEQETVSKNGDETTLAIKGRHDPVIAPRAVVVVECMCALTLLDAMLANMGARAEDVIRRYRG